MPLITPFLVVSALQWVAQHHEEIPALMHRSAEFLSDVITQGGIGNTVRRLGNTVIWNRPDGGTHIIGMLDQLDNRIDGLDIAQQGIQAGLGGLKNLSMITLGFSGLNAGLLVAQSAYLSRKLGGIKKDLKKIEVLINAQMESYLASALTALQHAESATGARRLELYHDALSNARDTGPYFSDQARNPDIHGNELMLLQFYSRKYFLALCIELASLIGSEDTEQVKVRLNSEESHLKSVATQVYGQTLAKDIELFLAPELKEVANIELVSDLLQQAKDLGCVTNETNFSPSDVFEANRKQIYSSGYLRAVSPKFGQFKRTAAARLHVAQSTFEEVLRLLSWRESVTCIEQHKLAPSQVARELSAFKDSLTTPTSSAPFIAYSLGSHSS